MNRRRFVTNLCTSVVALWACVTHPLRVFGRPAPKPEPVKGLTISWAGETGPHVRVQQQHIDLRYQLYHLGGLTAFLRLGDWFGLDAEERLLWLRWVEYAVSACGTAAYLVRLHPHLFARYELLHKELVQHVRATDPTLAHRGS